MKVWLPLIIALALSLLMNAFPAFMAFVIKKEGWGEAGWAFYFFTIPAAAVLIVIGLVISLVLWSMRKK